jgi:hypothetical protein
MSVRTFCQRASILIVVAVGAFFIGRFTQTGTTVASGSDTRFSSKPLSGSQKPKTLLKETAPREGSNVVLDLSRRASLPTRSLAADDERQKLIEQWAERDPRGAIEFIRTELKGDRQAQALSSVLAIWGKNEPAAAWSWVDENMPTATHHYDTLLEVFGKSSPIIAARFASEFALKHPEAALEVNLAALLGITYNGDFSAARAFVDGNLTLASDIRANLNNFIAGQWGRYAPEAAAAWAMSLPAGPERDQALIGVGESWAGVDPSGAAKFATTLPAGESRQLALRQAITNWMQTDPDQARQWVLDTNHHEDYDQAVAAIATQNNFMYREPDRALRWAGTIFDDTVRMQSTSAILFSLYARDPAAAVAYIHSASNLSDEQRTQLLTQFPAKP